MQILKITTRYKEEETRPLPLPHKSTTTLGLPTTLILQTFLGHAFNKPYCVKKKQDPKSYTTIKYKHHLFLANAV